MILVEEVNDTLVYDGRDVKMNTFSGKEPIGSVICDGPAVSKQIVGTAFANILLCSLFQTCGFGYGHYTYDIVCSTVRR